MQDAKTTPSPEAAETPETAAANGAEATSPEEQKIAQLEAQLKEKDAKYVYLYAEFDNFKKRAQREREDLRKFGWENTARDLLQVLDNLERAVAHTPPGTDKSLVDGLQMVMNQLRTTLHQHGVQVIEALAKPFDPNFHEAISQAPSDHPAGTVAQEHMKGFTLHGRLLRPSRVVVSEGKKSEAH